jgi:hypothetical protein
MKKSIFTFLFFLFISNNVYSQFIDSIHVDYDTFTEQIEIYLKGRFHSGDPDGIAGSNEFVSNDTLFFIVDYSICGTWPILLNFDTTFTLTKKLNPGILEFVMYSNYIQNLDSTDCRFSPLPDTIIDTAYFTLNIPLFTQEIEILNIIYPNPTQNIIHIPEQFLHKKFSIIDLLGRRCMEGILSDERLNLSTLKRGQYLLMIEGAKPVKIMKE